MRYLIDTNIISETMKAAPNPSVLSWIEAHEQELQLSSITVEELRFGEYLMPKGKKRAALSALIDALLASYADQVLSFDTPAAQCCARFHQQAIEAGRTPTIEDMMIAGIAWSTGCTLATHDVRDFDFLDIPIVDPFEETS